MAIDPELISPQIRASVEKICEKIAYGEVDSVKAVNHILRIYKNKYDYFVENFDRIDKSFKTEVIDKLNSKGDTSGKGDAKDK